MQIICCYLTLNINLIHSREYKTLGEHEERPWFVIPRHTNIKASTVTLSGSIIAFWSNEYIRLYTPEMLNEERPEKGQLKSHGVSDKLGQNICYWESVDLNHECLLASTNRNNFDVSYTSSSDLIPSARGHLAIPNTKDSGDHYFSAFNY